MRILGDENMPYVERLFAPFGEVVRVPGRSITAKMLLDVDALLIRSVTPVNEALLAHANRLAFVGSATIGTDHVDKELLAARGIRFSNAPGCNANAVCDYVLSCLLLLVNRKGLTIQGMTAGIIGMGNIGKRLKPRLEALGMMVLGCDPIRAELEPDFSHTPLQALLEQCDLLTFHVPHTRTGSHPTFHMMSDAELKQLKPSCILINACRGEVIDNLALKRHLQQGAGQSVVLDVWENEPEPDAELLALVDIATPHIAGYSQEGKALGTSMVYDQWAGLYDFPLSELSQLLPAPELAAMTLAAEPSQGLIKQLVQAVYEVRDDDERMRQASHQQGYFDTLRKHYPLRRELMSTRIKSELLSEKGRQCLAQLGFICHPEK